MEVEDDAEAARACVTLLEGETAFDGWAVKRGAESGLVWITDLRVVYAPRSGGVCALPIGKIDRMQVASSTELRLEAWHQHLPLAFSSSAQCSAFRNLLRQDQGWRGEVQTQQAR
jgi:hypothetical protein